MQLNAEDGGQRQHIQVQLPEATDAKSEASKAGYKTIAEIGKERIRRAGKKIVGELEAEIKDLKAKKKRSEEEEQELQDKQERLAKLDIGFVFKLTAATSTPGYDPTNAENLSAPPRTSSRPHRSDVLYEVCSNTAWTHATHRGAQHRASWCTTGMGALFLCLAEGITNQVAEGIVLGRGTEPGLRAIFRDNGFTDVERPTRCRP